MKKFLSLFLLLSVLALYPLSVMAAAKKPADVITDTVEYEKKRLRYSYYMPQTTTSPSEELVLVPGLNGQGKSMITKEWKQLADEKKWLILAPTFRFEGAKAFNAQQSYQYPKVWSGKALNAAFEKLAEDKGVRVSSLYMVGFSAGAQFVERYIFLYPDKIKKAAIISSGSNDSVEKRISTEIFYGIGEKDKDVRKEAATKFIGEAKNKGISIIGKTYPKTGHSFNKDMKADVIEFLKQK